VGDGIWVQGVSGLHSGTNPVSGDFSVGVTGRVIRGGALAEPIREATIASTLQRMLLDVVGIGAERLWLPGGTGAVPLAIDGVSLSGR
jgi:PmbA protein